MKLVVIGSEMIRLKKKFEARLQEFEISLIGNGELLRVFEK